MWYYIHYEAPRSLVKISRRLSDLARISEIIHFCLSFADETKGFGEVTAEWRGKETQSQTHKGPEFVGRQVVTSLLLESIL